MVFQVFKPPFLADAQLFGFGNSLSLKYYLHEFLYCSTGSCVVRVGKNLIFLGRGFILSFLAELLGCLLRRAQRVYWYLF
jgi:hypothetical protein